MGCHSSRQQNQNNPAVVYSVEAAIQHAQASFPLAQVPLRRVFSGLAPLLPQETVKISDFKELCKSWDVPSALLFGKTSPYRFFVDALIRNYTCLAVSQLLFSVTLLSDAPVELKASLCDSLYPESIVQSATAEWIIKELVEASCCLVPLLAMTTVDMEELIEYIESLGELKPTMVAQCLQAMAQDGLPFDSFQLGTRFCCELQALFSATDVRHFLVKEALVSSQSESELSLDESASKQFGTSPVLSRFELRKLEYSQNFSKISYDAPETGRNSLDSLISAVTPSSC